MRRFFTIPLLGFSLIIGSGSIEASENLIRKEPKSFYITGSTGVGFAKDQEVNINAAYQSTFGTKVLDEFDPGLNFELGVGYDFGSIRLEGTFTQGDSYMSKASSKTLDRYTEWADGTITTKYYSLGLYYDFKQRGKFTPYVGGGLGNSTLTSVKVREKWNYRDTVGNVNDSFTQNSYFGKVGVSYEINKKSDLFVESTYRVLNDINRTVGHYPSPTSYSVNLGVRYKI